MKRGSTIKPLAPAAHLTKQQYAYDTLRAAILKGELAPGTRLVIDDLANRFAISIIPVREALRLLQSEGLVVSVAHVGATVAPISRESVAEVFTLLEGLEVVAARTAAGRATAADLDRARRDRRRRWTRRSMPDGPQRWAELNTRFHLAIAALSGMPMLQQMLQRAFDHWGRVRRFYFSGVLVPSGAGARRPNTIRCSITCARKDVPSLEAVVREHNQAALDAYTAYLDSASLPATSGGAIGHERDSLSPRRHVQERRGVRASPRRGRHRLAVRRRTGPGRELAARHARSSWAASASATDSASCRWKAGTALEKANRAS